MILLRSITETTGAARHVRPGDFVLLETQIGRRRPRWYTVVTNGDIDGFEMMQLLDPDTGELFERGFKSYADVTRRTASFETQGV